MALPGVQRLHNFPHSVLEFANSLRFDGALLGSTDACGEVSSGDRASTSDCALSLPRHARQVLIASEVTKRLPADVIFTPRVTRDEAEEPLESQPVLPVAAPGCRELCWLEGRKEVRGGGKPGTYRSAAQSGIISVSNTQRTTACLPPSSGRR